MLVQVAVNISLWLMVHRLPQNMGYERRECLYNEPLNGSAMSQSSKPPRIFRFTYPRTVTPITRNPLALGSMPPTDTTIKHQLKHRLINVRTMRKVEIKGDRSWSLDFVTAVEITRDTEKLTAVAKNTLPKK